MRKASILGLIFTAFFIAACGEKTIQSAPQPVAQEPVMEAPAEVPAEAVPAEQPAEQSAEQPADAQAQPKNDGNLKDYTAPEGVYTLQIPSSWSVEKDKTFIENTVVETFTAPDGNAYVQVLVNDVGQGLDHVLKREVTLDYMHRLFGDDLRIATDSVLADGRERLEWWTDQNKISGTTYFDQVPGYLYFFTVGYMDAYENKYKDILNRVDKSFSIQSD